MQQGLSQWLLLLSDDGSTAAGSCLSMTADLREGHALKDPACPKLQVHLAHLLYLGSRKISNTHQRMGHTQWAAT